MDIRILSISALAAVSLFGTCGGAGQGESGRKVTAAEFGERWPLTVPEGYVDCVPVDAAIFTSGARSYALNVSHIFGTCSLSA